MDGGNWKHFDFRIALPEKRSQLTEENMKEPLKDIRRALLQADVSLPVVRRVVRRIEEGSLGTKVTRGVTPDQQLVQVVANELLNMMGPEASPLELPSPGEGSPNDPAVVALIGLQGAPPLLSLVLLPSRVVGFGLHWVQFLLSTLLLFLSRFRQNDGCSKARV